MKQKFFELRLKTNGQKLYNFTDQTINWIKEKRKKKYEPTGFLVGKFYIYVTTNNGRILVVNFKEGKIDKTLKLSNNKLQRAVYFNKSLYIAKDNSIIRLN